jgi:hypothetical protein
LGGWLVDQHETSLRKCLNSREKQIMQAKDYLNKPWTFTVTLVVVAQKIH